MHKMPWWKGSERDGGGSRDCKVDRRVKFSARLRAAFGRFRYRTPDLFLFRNGHPERHGSEARTHDRLTPHEQALLLLRAAKKRNLRAPPLPATQPPVRGSFFPMAHAPLSPEADPPLGCRSAKPRQRIISKQ